MFDLKVVHQNVALMLSAHVFWINQLIRMLFILFTILNFERKKTFKVTRSFSKIIIIIIIFRI